MVENSMEVSQKTKNRTTIWPNNSTPGYISKKKSKPLIWKDTCTPMFIAALFTIAKICKQPKCPLIDEWINIWMDKEDVQQHGWMDLEGIMLSEVSHTEKDKYCKISLTCGI